VPLSVLCRSFVSSAFCICLCYERTSYDSITRGGAGGGGGGGGDVSLRPSCSYGTR